MWSSLNNNWEQLLTQLFGPGIGKSAFAHVSWADLIASGFIILLLLFLHGAAAWWVNSQSASSDKVNWWRRTLLTISRPLYLFLWVLGVYLAVLPLFPSGESEQSWPSLQRLWNRLFDIASFTVLFWTFMRLTRLLEEWLLSLSEKTKSTLDDAFVPLLGKTLRVVVPGVALILLLPVVNLPPEYSGVISKISSLLIIGMISWVLIQIVSVLERVVLSRYDITVANNLQARKVHTQVHVISKTAYVIIAIFTVASALMLFEEVRRFGASILASAGIIGIIAGFAAQKTIANLFAGFQLAMTQPIRIDDVVIVENEWGRVEEITLTYVVVRIWDARRLVVPLSYFIEQPFQNWTRVSAELMGVVTVWADYTVPVEELRQATKEIVENESLWDRRFWNLQVVDATDRAIQLRVLATAANSGDAWNLRCEIREKLIAHIQRKYPNSLPRVRAELENPSAEPKV
mgnify:CR=1 FL=1|jgi:Small-conductance mechanosensitive channel